MHRATLQWAQSTSSFKTRPVSVKILKLSLELDLLSQGRKSKAASSDLLSKSVRIIRLVQLWSIWAQKSRKEKGKRIWI